MLKSRKKVNNSAWLNLRKGKTYNIQNWTLNLMESGPKKNWKLGSERKRNFWGFLQNVPSGRKVLFAENSPKRWKSMLIGCFWHYYTETDLSLLFLGLGQKCRKLCGGAAGRLWMMPVGSTSWRGPCCMNVAWLLSLKQMFFSGEVWRDRCLQLHLGVQASHRWIRYCSGSRRQDWKTPGLLLLSDVVNGLSQWVPGTHSKRM